MTALEWLISAHFGSVEMCTPDFRNKIKQALELEKQQTEKLKEAILELFEMVHNSNNIQDKIRANDIYSETYKCKTEL